MAVVAWLLLALAVGSGVYCILVVIAARHHLRVKPPSLKTEPGLSVLKPLHGLEEGLESNLRTIFEQSYNNYEVLMAVRTGDDLAVPLVRQLQSEYPHISSRLLFVGEPPWVNAKTWSLHKMTEEAKHEILVMSDSDIRVTPDFLRTLAAEFADPDVGVSSCPYRAVPGVGSPASTLEAIGMNTEFLATALVARMLEGMKFALGPTLTSRKQVIAEIGGWQYLSEFLAEDFVLGNKASENGWKVLFSSYVVEHHIGAQSWRVNARHRIRWCRSTRRSRPAGYVGQLFTNPLPILLLLVLVKPEWWPVAMGVFAARIAAAIATAAWILRDPLTLTKWYLLPIQDLLSFVFWVAGFFGTTVDWRGRKFEVLPDGRFTLKVNQASANHHEDTR
ncbi:MAG: bacteriohopanetetrol glucosamine biosynthesis glycosyltransferase HpnI [Bryobacteraceae bacterium]|nr:bacteriohopanetetrol glucosamine biosynthesis glycosyltransferase HpnI [Bryobacteraceae bacterium]